METIKINSEEPPKLNVMGDDDLGTIKISGMDSPKNLLISVLALIY